MKKIITLSMIIIILLITIGCNQEKEPMELIKQENMLTHAKEIVDINKEHDMHYSESLFYSAYMFDTYRISKFVLYERPGPKEKGYFVLDKGAMICDQYGIDYRKYGNGKKVLIMIDKESKCKKIILESRANKKIIASFDVEGMYLLFLDLEEWGDIEKVDYVSFRTADNEIIREERIL